jgi:WD40 repeat protein
MRRMESHDSGVQTVEFSHDQRLLLSTGSAADRRIFVWDMAT